MTIFLPREDVKNLTNHICDEILIRKFIYYLDVVETLLSSFALIYITAQEYSRIRMKNITF